MLYLIGGASGSGKSSLLPHLRQLAPDVRWHDFDERWAGGGKRERQELQNGWLETAAGHNGDFGLLAQLPLGEVLAAPACPPLTTLRHLLLDVHDLERMRRLRARGDGLATQTMLGWAYWLRVHQADPTWHPEVLTDGGWDGMQWPRWLGAADPAWPGVTLDSTGLSVEETARQVWAALQGCELWALGCEL